MLRTFILQDEARCKALYAFLKQNWQACAKAEKPLAVTIAEHGDKRSVPQNKRYWAALIDEIHQQAWVGGKQFSKEAWHKFFAGKFIGMEEGPDGQMYPMSTVGLNTAEFSSYMLKVEVYAADELGLELTQ